MGPHQTSECAAILPHEWLDLMMVPHHAPIFFASHSKRIASSLMHEHLLTLISNKEVASIFAASTSQIGTFMIV